MSRTPVAQRSFADLEFIQQGIQLEVSLHAVATLLDAHASLEDGVRADLTRGLKNLPRAAPG